MQLAFLDHTAGGANAFVTCTTFSPLYLPLPLLTTASADLQGTRNLEWHFELLSVAVAP